jgi:hypothetical protein
MNHRTIRALLALLAIFAGLLAQPLVAQRPAGAVVRGTVKDDTGGVIPRATITLANPSGTVQTTTSEGDGSFVFRGVAPGAYTVSAAFTGLQTLKPVAVNVAPNQPATANIVMALKEQKQEVNVSESSDNTVSTEAANNANSLVLKKEDLDALPDDPDDLQADLQALAGPAAGPGGNQIYIDGFTGGRLPPKESIREIRINSNPFSAEFDKLGYGRIQIFTKPGSDRFHGQGYYNISDGVWNSRNPFLSVNPPFRTQLFGGNVSGPISKHASFFVDVERRNIDDNGIINATIPGQNLLSGVPYQNFFPTPQRRTTVSPRADFQLGSKNTLSFRYYYLNSDRQVTGIGSFDLPATTIGNLTLPSTGYSTPSTEQGVQVVETAVLSARVVNETHFRYDRSYESWVSQSQAPELSVSQSFVAGGSGYSAPGFPRSYDLENGLELQNYTSFTWGAHTTKFGVRVRTTLLNDSSPKGFNGTYQFLGGAFPLLDSNFQTAGGTTQLSSIQQYLLTEQLLNSGMSSAAVTALGYGPSKYSVSAGNPYIGLNQTDAGPFIQDDWRVMPNLTLSLGTRWESQTNVPDHNDWAPRFGFAWSPDAKANGGKAKTVIRGGWGMFYDRFGIANVETAYRYSQSNLETYTLNNPTTYDATFGTPIPLSILTSGTVSAAQRYQIDSNLKIPRLYQTAVGVERQLFGHTTLTLNFTNSRGSHELRTVDINAPIPTTGSLPPGASQSSVPLVRPYGNIGDIYNYESDGTFKQTQVLVNVRSQVGRWLTLFGRYAWSNAHSDTDGLGTMPSDPYNFAADWGRSQLDIEHSLFIGGSIAAKWGLRFSPFIVAHSGTPFNITTGTDLYLQGQGASTARPSIVDYTTPYSSPFGFLNPDPLVGTTLVERNAGTGAGFLGINLRVSKTWGFGTTKFQGPSGGSRGGGGGGHRGGFGGGFRGGDESSHRYNLTLSLNARNILNHENLNTFNGALTSPYFFQATGITGGYGAESTASNQRRLDLQLRFAF